MLKLTVLHQTTDLINHNFKVSAGIPEIFFFSNIQLAIHVIGFLPFSEGLDVGQSVHKIIFIRQLLGTSFSCTL